MKAPTTCRWFTYASNNVNSTANLARGSLNLTENMALSNGYKFVWEFTPNQGNGTIAAVALTSALGGQNGFGSLVGDASTFLQLKAADIGAIPDANKMVLFEAVEMDFENSLLYSITFENAAVWIRKLRIPVFSIGLNEKLDDSTYTVLEDEVLTPETFEFPGSYTKYGNSWTGRTDTGMGFPMKEILPGTLRCSGARFPKRIIPLQWGRGRCPMPS